MKKLMIVILIGLSATTLTAQHISIGPSVGIGQNWLNTDINSSGKNLVHPSFNIGGKLVYSILSNWGVSADVKFSGEGGSRGVDNSNKTVNRINFLRIPIQGIYFFGKYGDRVRPKISIGPSFGFVVGGNQKVISNGQTISEIANKDYLNKLDIGVNAAAGANIRISKSTWLNADLTYYHGLTDISKAAGKLQQRGIGINVGVLFPFGAN